MIPHSNYALPDFEKQLVEIMINEKCTLRQAIDLAFSVYNIDTNNVFRMVDFLEAQVYDLDKVQFMMMVYTGSMPDFQLERLVDNAEEKRPDES